MKIYRFFMHFNRVNMQRGSPNVWSVHFRGTCYMTPKVIVGVPIESVYKPNGKQPRVILRGWARNINVYHDRIFVT